MSEQLLGSRIASLRGQVRRLLVFHGLSWVVAAIIPLVILAGLADWGFHLDFFVRLSILAIIVGVALWLFAKRVIRPLIVRFGDLDIALKIEKRWPGLNDRLASTIQFLRLSKDDQRYGSSELREATVRQAIEETKSIDFREVIEYRPVVRAASFAVSGLLLASSFALVAPESSRLALRRLFLPWAGDRWPQKTHLLLNPGETSLKIARGDSFTLSVGVKPGDRIPETARVTYRFSDGEENTELLRPVEGGEFRGRLDTVNQNFSFSVAAGDDASSIRDVDVKVVPPPALTDLKIRLVPPAYTGIPVQTLVGGLTSFKVLSGTRVELDAQFNKPLAEAVLALEDKATADPLAYNEKRTSFKTGFTASEALGFSFQLKDLEGFQNREAGRHEVRVFKDEPPRVMIVDPKTDRDVPADAVIPIRVDLDDDYGLHSARMTYQVSAGDSEPKPAVVIPLWSAPTEDAAQVQSSFVKHQGVSYEWNLESLGLSSGSIITFHADARDYDTIKGPNIGKSREIRLRIISKEDAARQFDDSRRDLREEISRILAMQRQAIQPVDEASRVLDRTARLSRPQRDNLNNAGLIQRQVGSRISHREDGLEQKIRRMLDDLKNFKIGNDEAQAQMQEMLERLAKLRDQNLETAEQELSRAGKSLDQVNEQTDEKSGQASQPNGTDQAKEQGQDRAKSQDKPSDQAGPQDGADADKSKAADAGKSAAESKDQVKTPEAKAQDGETGKPAQKNDRLGEKADAEDKPEQPAEASKAGPSSKPLDAAKQSLTQAKANQQAIADELNQMLNSLGEFETFRGVVKDAQDLLKKQEEAIKQSSDAASKPDFAGKKAEELSPEQKNDLENLARQQSELSKDLQSLQERMKGLAGKMEESDAQGASAMREATENSQKQGTAGKMAEAAERLQQNQLGQAKAQQEKARQELRDLIDSIQNRKERELSRLVKDLKQAENELRQLRKRQAQNLMATREAKKNPNAQERQQQLKKLAKEQAQIQEELKRQLQKLSKLNAERAGKAAANAQAKMGKAQQDLDDDQGDGADKNEEEALADLNDAQEELEEARKEAEERLGMEQLARMADQIKSLAERQVKMVADTKEREDLREKNDGRLTPAQRTSVRELGLVQAGLKEETDAMTNQLEGAPVFSLTLRRAGESMDVAAQRLQTIKTDEETQKAVKTAADRFQQLLESLKADDQKGGQGQQGGGGGGGGGGGSGGGDGIPATAQLKMLKTLQRELNDRTEAFDELRRRSKQLTPQQLKEVDELAADQGSLADLVRDLTRPKKDDGEE